MTGSKGNRNLQRNVSCHHSCKLSSGLLPGVDPAQLANTGKHDDWRRGLSVNTCDLFFRLLGDSLHSSWKIQHDGVFAELSKQSYL